MAGFIASVYYKSIAVVHDNAFESAEVRKIQAELNAAFEDRQREEELRKAAEAAGSSSEKTA